MAPKPVCPKPVPENALAIMELLPKGGVGLETGTHMGRFTHALKTRTSATHMTLIDPWHVDPDRAERPFAFKQRAVRMGHFRDHVAAQFAGQKDIDIHVRRSVDVIAKLGPLDWAWLDGPKYYDEVMPELEAVVSRMVPNGVIAGGGYFWGKQLGRPVRQAVKDLVARLPGARLEQRGQFWAVHLPDVIALETPQTAPRFLMISTMKNEAPFILEWIAHHQAIGFTDFLIFTNDCEDTTDALLDRLQKHGGVHHEYNLVLRRGPHKSALKYARHHALTAKADWVMISDVDEFLNIRAGDGTVQGLLAHLGPETDVVPFPWKVFGNTGIERFEDAPITHQFTECEPTRNGRRMRDVKTLFRHPERMHHFGLHRPRVSPEWRDQTVWTAPDGTDISARMNDGQPWMMAWDGCEAAAYQHHYPLRSMESYLLKKNRGRANHVGEDLGLAYWDKWNLVGATDRSLVQGHPKFRAEFEKLWSDRKLRRLHREGVAWHRAQFETLMKNPVYGDLYETLKARQRNSHAAE